MIAQKLIDKIADEVGRSSELIDKSSGDDVEKAFEYRRPYYEKLEQIAGIIGDFEAGSDFKVQVFKPADRDCEMIIQSRKKPLL